jgi:hypothetical protein
MQRVKLMAAAFAAAAHTIALMGDQMIWGMQEKEGANCPPSLVTMLIDLLMSQYAASVRIASVTSSGFGMIAFSCSSL